MTVRSNVGNPMVDGEATEDLKRHIVTEISQIILEIMGNGYKFNMKQS